MADVVRYKLFLNSNKTIVKTVNQNKSTHKHKNKNGNRNKTKPKQGE